MNTQLSPKAVKRRYFREIGIASVGYMASIIALSPLLSDEDPLTVTNVALMLIPVVFLLLTVVAMWRYFESVDEVLRAVYGRALLVAGFAVIAVSGAWGLLELMNQNVPKLPVFFVFPLFMGTFGIASSVGRNRGFGCA